jgi:hypothetical protein
LIRLTTEPGLLHRLSESGRGVARNFRRSEIAARMLDDFEAVVRKRYRSS